MEVAYTITKPFTVIQAQLKKGQTKYTSLYLVNSEENEATFLTMKTSVLIDILTIEDKLNGIGIVGRVILLNADYNDSGQLINNYYFFDIK